MPVRRSRTWIRAMGPLAYSSRASRPAQPPATCSRIDRPAADWTDCRSPVPSGWTAQIPGGARSASCSPRNTISLTERRQPRDEMGRPADIEGGQPAAVDVDDVDDPGCFPVLRDRKTICLLSGDQSSQSRPRPGVSSRTSVPSALATMSMRPQSGWPQSVGALRRNDQLRPVPGEGRRRSRMSAPAIIGVRWPSADRRQRCRHRGSTRGSAVARRAERLRQALARPDQSAAAPMAMSRPRTTSSQAILGAGARRRVMSTGSHLSRLDHAGRCRSVRVRRRTASRCSGTRCSASAWSQSEMVGSKRVVAVHAGRPSRMSGPGRASASSAARISRTRDTGVISWCPGGSGGSRRPRTTAGRGSDAGR